MSKNKKKNAEKAKKSGNAANMGRKAPNTDPTPLFEATGIEAEYLIAMTCKAGGLPLTFMKRTPDNPSPTMAVPIQRADGIVTAVFGFCENMETSWFRLLKGCSVEENQCICGDLAQYEKRNF